MIGVPKNDPFVPQSTSKRTLFSFCLSFFFSRPNLRHPRACFCLFFFVWFSFFFFFLFFGFLLVPSSSFCFLPRGTPGGCVSVCFFSLGCFAPISLPCFALLCFEQTTKKPSPVHTHTHTHERESNGLALRCFACHLFTWSMQASQPQFSFSLLLFIFLLAFPSLPTTFSLPLTLLLACLPSFCFLVLVLVLVLSCSFFLFFFFFVHHTSIASIHHHGPQQATASTPRAQGRLCDTRHDGV